MSHEKPLQLEPLAFLRSPNGPPLMRLAVSDRADDWRKLTVCDDDMWPNFARSHWMIASGLLDTHGRQWAALATAASAR